MRNDALLIIVAKEARPPDPLGTVKELVRHDEVSRANLLSQRPDGRKGDDEADANGLEGGDVGQIGYAGGSDVVREAVSSEEGDGDARGSL